MVTYPQRITLCGFGGQGIILSAVILGTTAVTKGDLYAVQTQSYGSEARGGQCQSELIIDKKAINSPVAEKKNLLVAMFQTAYEKYIPTLEDDGVLVIDPGLVTKITRPIKTTFEVPATQIAVDLGNRMAANMVMLGFLSESLGIIRREDLLDVVKDTVNPRFVELNFKAVEAGIAYAKENDLYHK
ncbi:2-oxoacid:acceptor oxidoreductase family protein [Lacrimispora sp. NSJ-141]|uniref:2-oxoacid:acceptor oxidoreductase family protein n=1 Tax=Lientehia hominis TaxID=2897778 RepID=A0AAP2RKN8_9FIRM|nr:2-oxoacid:acceptor oxidoreductase family protein [Lientehia hominis]MCD2492548.1 2-oxoacid:acceptor oxidoreductase family protein [Lientehia hominis]